MASGNLCYIFTNVMEPPLLKTCWNCVGYGFLQPNGSSGFLKMAYEREILEELKPVSHTGTTKISDNSLCLFVTYAFLYLKTIFVFI